MAKVSTLALLIGLMPALAFAKTYKLGDDKPVAQISIPDDWKPSEIENGVEATSADKETYVAAEVVAGADVEQAAKEEIDFFKKQKITLKPETAKENKANFAGLPAYDVSWEATDEDGPTHVSATFVQINEKQVVMLTYWGSPAGEKSNGPALAEIAASLKPVN